MQSPMKFTARKGKVSVGNESYLSARKGPSWADQKKWKGWGSCGFFSSV